MMSESEWQHLIGKNVRIVRKAGDSWSGKLESDEDSGDPDPDGTLKARRLMVLLKKGITVSFRPEDIESVEEVSE